MAYHDKYTELSKILKEVHDTRFEIKSLKKTLEENVEKAKGLMDKNCIEVDSYTARIKRCKKQRVDTQRVKKYIADGLLPQDLLIETEYDSLLVVHENDI